jgi:hypothetical protein
VASSGEMSVYVIDPRRFGISLLFATGLTRWMFYRNHLPSALHLRSEAN